jgi:hypothetical protein
MGRLAQLIDAAKRLTGGSVSQEERDAIGEFDTRTNANADCQTGPGASVKAIEPITEKTRMTIRVG